MAALALDQGWETPGDTTRDRPLLNQGNFAEEEDEENWNGWSRNFDKELTEIKLRIAERTRDVDTYLTLCLKENAHFHYGEKLVTLGRMDEARDHAVQWIVSPDEILALAQMMQTANAIKAAYVVGLHGLALAGNKYRLGKWFAIFAESLGHPDMALKAWRAAFNTIPELESYQHLKRLSGDGWAALRPEFRHRLEPQRGTNISVLVEILIDDGEIQHAITLWDNNNTWYMQDLLAKLVEAAGALAPDWAISKAMKAVNEQIGRGSKYYSVVAEWLKRVKAIYQQHGRTDEWMACITTIRETHKRKSSLMPLLKGL